MRASLHVRADLGFDGHSIATTVRGEPPLLARVTGREPLTVHLVGGAAGPLGGDDLHTSIGVGPGASLQVRSVAASLAQPGPTPGERSTADVHAIVDDGGHLDFWPQPLVSVAGSNHEVRTRIELSGAASLRWVDCVVLGRSSEHGGAVVLHQRATRDGATLMHHTVSVPGGAGGRAAHGGRVLMCALTVDTSAGTAPDRVDPLSVDAASCVGANVRAVRCPLGQGAATWIAIADEYDDAVAALTGLGLFCSVA